MRPIASHPCAVAICFLLLAGSAGPAVGQDWQQKHTPGELLSLATAAYRALPEVPSSADAKPFLVAMANLFAYAQVSPRMASEPAHAAEVGGALEWLTSNLGNVVPAGGKGDVDELRFIESRGLAAYDSVRNRQGQLATPFRSYVAAVTNLYVVRQAASSPSQKAFGALGWLRDNPVGLAAGVSGKADESGAAGPTLPTGPKPALFGAGAAVAPGGVDLSGRWTANDGGTYYVRQIGKKVWWYGESGDGGQSWTNVFYGSFNFLSRSIRGQWTDVPKGTARSSGVLALRLSVDGRELTALERTGGFGGGVWRR